MKSISSTMDSDPRLGSFLLDPSIKKLVSSQSITSLSHPSIKKAALIIHSYHSRTLPSRRDLSTTFIPPTLSLLLNIETFLSNIKLEGIAGVASSLKVSDLSKNLLEALAENNRLAIWFETLHPSFQTTSCNVTKSGHFLLPRLGFTKAVVASFDTLMAAHRGEVVCVVTTAKVSFYLREIAVLTAHRLAGAWRRQQEGGRGRPGGIPQVWREGSHFLCCWPCYCRWHGGKLNHFIEIWRFFKISF